MEWLAIVPVIVAIGMVGVIAYIGVASRGRTSITSRMMEQNMDVLKNMTTGDMSERLKEMSKTALEVKKSILEENKDSLKEMAKMEAEIEKDAIKVKAAAVKEGFSDGNTMYCKHCGAIIDSDSKFCKSCGKQQ